MFIELFEIFVDLGIEFLILDLFNRTVIVVYQLKRDGID